MVFARGVVSGLLLMDVFGCPFPESLVESRGCSAVGLREFEGFQKKERLLSLSEGRCELQRDTVFVKLLYF